MLNHAMQCILRITASLFLCILAVLAKAEPPSNTEGDSLMPNDFKGIWLGMSDKQFKSVRNLNPAKDIDGHEMPMYFERNIKSTYASNAIYFFKEGKLSAVVLVKEVSGKDIKTLAADYIEERIGQWGKDFKVAITQGERGPDKYPLATLIWEKNKAILTASFPPKTIVTDDRKMYSVITRIMNPDFEKDKTFSLLFLTPTEEEWRQYVSDLAPFGGDDPKRKFNVPPQSPQEEKRIQKR
jgi:hypothetical protein